MPEDTSLSDFFGGGGTGDESDPDDGDSSPPAGTDPGEAGDPQSPADDDRVSPGAVEPATTTAVWSPDGAACSACGTAVEHRWRDEDGLVCADCKEW